MISLLIADGRTLLVLVVAILALPYWQSNLSLLLLLFQWKLVAGSVPTSYPLKNDLELLWLLLFRRR